MKIFVASDLHLEFHPYPFELPEADIAILAGDILVIAKSGQSGQLRQDYAAKDFLSRVNEKYSAAYWIAGNHEFYHGNINTGVAELRTWVAKQGWENIHILDNEVVSLPNNFKLIASTLWTDFDDNNPMIKEQAQSWMSDYRLIKKGDNHKLFADDILKIHRQSREFITNEMKDNAYKYIVVTHHSPCFASTAERFRGDSLNGAFHSKMEYLFNENIPYWIHGHIHDRMQYTIDGTTVVANPRGYPGENPAFDPNLVLEI